MNDQAKTNAELLEENSFLNQRTQELEQSESERKRAEEALRESEEKHRLLIENSHDISYTLTAEGVFTFISPAWTALLGHPVNQVVGKPFQLFVHPDDFAGCMVFLQAVIETGQRREGVEYRVRHTDGSWRWHTSSAVPLRDEAGTIVRFEGIARDITERKRAQEALRESETRYRLLAENATDVIWTVGMDMRLTYVSPSVTRLLGFTVEEAMARTMQQVYTPVAFEKAMQIFAEEMTIESAGHGDPTRSRMLELELVRKDGNTVPVEGNFCFLRDPTGKAIGMLSIVRDITERKRVEKKLQNTLDSLRKAFGTTIQVMISAIEVRDPYTAGHQLRSTDLARAIATEMGLPQEKIDGIRMAGSIHDIGKLSVPAEILSKPTKLTNIEFSLIKEHSQKGYEMLKDVESPWPLAEIVYQHHERMDGSGYPRNLKGDDILMEARIMAVADVVEAMASHRPYRAGLGIDVALAEIEKNKGILYDSTAADACLRLFREKGFKLEGT